MPYRLEGDAAWLDRWRQNDRPTADAADELQRWLGRLVDDPRQLPSSAGSRQHPHLQDELRAAFLLDAGGVFIVYAIAEPSGIVRILHIANDPPEGVEFRLPP